MFVWRVHMQHDRSRRISNLDCLHMLVSSIHNASITNALFSYAAFAFYASVHRFASAISKRVCAQQISMNVIHAALTCRTLSSNRQHLVNEIIVSMLRTKFLHRTQKLHSIWWCARAKLLTDSSEWLKLDFNHSLTRPIYVNSNLSSLGVNSRSSKSNGMSVFSCLWH